MYLVFPLKKSDKAPNNLRFRKEDDNDKHFTRKKMQKREYF